MQFEIKDGMIMGFKDEIEKLQKKQKIEILKTKRVSHIYPANFFLKIAFIFLRFVFGENGKIANWTRKWKCKWSVFIPQKGVFGKYSDREKAIKKEKELIWQTNLKI